MLIRFTKSAGGNSVGQILDTTDTQGEKLLELGVAIPVEQGEDGRIIITRSGRKIPRRDRSATAEQNVDQVE